MADISPKTSVLRGMKHTRLPWKLIMGEFIDNAFDASATRITFEFDKRRLVIVDDGAGCADVLKMLTLGDRENHEGTRLGCYGVGAKDAAISAADGISIFSVHRGIRRSVNCNWKILERSNTWKIPDPEECQTVDPNGTKIVLEPLRNDHKPDEAALLRSLSIQYTPAIRQGRQIVLKMGPKKQPVTVPEFRLPALEHQITADLNVGGRMARVTVGIVPDGIACPLSGMVVSYGYRVILSDTRIGLGTEPTPNLIGWCELGTGWELTKNKDNISSNQDELSSAIFQACRDTISKAAARAKSVVFDGVSTQINAALQSIIGAESNRKAKAKRHKGTSKGTVAPTMTGRKHTQAAVTQPGNTFNLRSNNATCLKVAFESMTPDGPACKYNSGIVYLNKDNAVIRSQMNDEAALSVHAIYAVATYLATEEGPQMALFEKHDATTLVEKMSVMAGMLLATVRTGTTAQLRATA